MEFKEYIVQHFAPLVAILSSEETQATCLELTGGSLADLLRPLASLRQLSAPVRTVGEQSYRIRDLHLRFHPAQNMRQAAPEAAQAQLQSVITAAEASSKDQSTTNLPEALKKGALPRQTPWFDSFKHEFVRQLAFSELETLDHPVACLLVVDASSEDPLAAFQKLLKRPDIPALLRSGLADGRIMKYYLLLSYTPTQHRNDGKISALRGAFGEHSCQMLNITPTQSARSTAQADSLNQTSSQEANPSLPRQTSGQHAESISNFLEHFCTRALLPQLEFQVRSLYQQVMASRKGVRNQLKNLLWRSKSSAMEQPRARPGAQGWAGTVEAQLRNLADLAFLMQDYNLCITTLNSLSSDLKSSKDWPHYASAQEMLAVASFMAGLPPSEVIACFKDAFYRYDMAAGRADQEMRRYATRSQLLLADFCCERRLFAEANAALMRAQSHESNLVAAVLLEQAALHLLHTSPPAMRKWAFHLVLAALRFSNCNQSQLADRAYRQVLAAFQGQGWEHINAHLQDMLGRHALEQKDYNTAASHFAATLSMDTPCHANRQNQLFTQFLHTMSQLSPEQLEERAPSMPLPRVYSRQVEVNCDSLLTFANNLARSSPHSFWVGFAGPMYAGQESSSQSGMLEPARTSGGARYFAAVGEEITLDVDIYNPLALQLRVDQLRVSTECMASDNIQVEDQEVTLRGKEKVRVRLKFTGVCDCTFDIKGISWRLDGHVPGYKALQMRQLPQPRSRGVKRSTTASCPASFQIVSGMPHLQVAFVDLPAQSLVGEVIHCTAQLHNNGSAPITSLRMLCSHPELYCLPNQQILGHSLESTTDFPPLRSADEGFTNKSRILKGRKTMHQWCSDFRLEAGQTIDWPFLLRLTEDGHVTLHCVWQYNAGPLQSAMPFRLLNWSHSIQVSPALEMKAKLMPTTTDVQRCLLYLHVAASQDIGEIEIQHIASTSPAWPVAALTAHKPEKGELPASTQPPVVLHGRSSHHVCSTWPSNQAFSSGDPLQAFGCLSSLCKKSAVQSSIQGKGSEESTLGGASEVEDGAEQQSQSEMDSLSLVVGWKMDVPDSTRPSLGLTTLTCHIPQADVMLRAVVKGQTKHSWDFAKGPLQVNLRLQLCQFCNQPASICCETGTNLHLSAPSKEVRKQWVVRSTPEKLSRLAGGLEGGASLSRQTSEASSNVSDPAIQPMGGEQIVVGPPSLPSVMWIGQTQTSLPQVAPERIVEIPLQVLVFRPGRFLISDYAVYWTFPSGELNAAKAGPEILLDIDQA